jgi:hypothetical protein
MQINVPGDEIVREWPPNAPEEERARFVFVVPDYKASKEIVRLLFRVRSDEMTLHDAARAILGLTLDRVENLTRKGTDEPIDVEKKGTQLSEDCAGQLAPMFNVLVGMCNDLLIVTEPERKNS